MWPLLSAPPTELTVIMSPSTFQILFYALRPTFVRAQTLTRWHFFNIAAQLAFDYTLVSTFGPRPLIYLIASSFFAGSLHPCAGHFIAEHYLWDGLSQETYSYYGPLNILAYNVCFHSHHNYHPAVRLSVRFICRWAITTSITISHQFLGLACPPSVP